MTIGYLKNMHLNENLFLEPRMNTNGFYKTILSHSCLLVSIRGSICSSQDTVSFKFDTLPKLLDCTRHGFPLLRE